MFTVGKTTLCVAFCRSLLGVVLRVYGHHERLAERLAERRLQVSGSSTGPMLVAMEDAVAMLSCWVEKCTSQTIPPILCGQLWLVQEPSQNEMASDSDFPWNLEVYFPVLVKPLFSLWLSRSSTPRDRWRPQIRHCYHLGLLVDVGWNQWQTSVTLLRLSPGHQNSHGCLARASEIVQHPEHWWDATSWFSAQHTWPLTPACCRQGHDTPASQKVHLRQVWRHSTASAAWAGRTPILSRAATVWERSWKRICHRRASALHLAEHFHRMEGSVCNRRNCLEQVCHSVAPARFREESLLWGALQQLSKL